MVRYLTSSRLLKGEVGENGKEDASAGATDVSELYPSSTSFRYSTFFRFESGGILTEFWEYRESAEGRTR